MLLVSTFLGIVEILLEFLKAIGEYCSQNIESLDEVETSANVGGGLVDVHN